MSCQEIWNFSTSNCFKDYKFHNFISKVMEAYPCKKEICLYQVTTYYQLPLNMFRIVKSLTPLDYMETISSITWMHKFCQTQNKLFIWDDKSFIELVTPFWNLMLPSCQTVDEIKTIEIIPNGLLNVDTH